MFCVYEADKQRDAIIAIEDKKVSRHRIHVMPSGHYILQWYLSNETLYILDS